MSYNPVHPLWPLSVGAGEDQWPTADPGLSDIDRFTSLVGEPLWAPRPPIRGQFVGFGGGPTPPPPPPRMIQQAPSSALTAPLQHDSLVAQQAFST